MTPAEVRETLLDLRNTLFPVTSESYLTTPGRPLWGLLIEPEHRRFPELFGDIPERDLRLFNTRFADTKAGFATGAQSLVLWIVLQSRCVPPGEGRGLGGRSVTWRRSLSTSFVTGTSTPVSPSVASGDNHRGP
jgi:hypothetical protein